MMAWTSAVVALIAWLLLIIYMRALWAVRADIAEEIQVCMREEGSRVRRHWNCVKRTAIWIVERQDVQVGIAQVSMAAGLVLVFAYLSARWVIYDTLGSAAIFDSFDELILIGCAFVVVGCLLHVSVYVGMHQHAKPGLLRWVGISLVIAGGVVYVLFDWMLRASAGL